MKIQNWNKSAYVIIGNGLRSASVVAKRVPLAHNIAQKYTKYNLELLNIYVA